MGGYPGVPDTDEAVGDAVAKSCLGDLPRPLLATMLADAGRRRIPGGSMLRSAGDLVGLPSLFRDTYVMVGSIQAVEESDVVALRPAVVRDLADANIEVCRTLIRELSERVVSFVAEIPGNMFASVRQRVARHLLDLATNQQVGPDLMASVSQQELADAVGTAREVVVRVLRDLRADGLVATGRDGISILDPAKLYAERLSPG
jgi:CRP/FNR family cyclic AMP-dependent transcriptional regulator